MNREDGFIIADVDVGLFHDPKVLALARRNRDEQRTAVQLALYVALILQSWEAGDRVELGEAIPAWWMGSVDDARDALQAVGLIDDETRVPVAAWQDWFIPAFDRREKRRRSGAEGGRRSWESRKDKRRFSDASATPNPSDRPADRPTGRPAVREASARTALAAAATSESNCKTCKYPKSICICGPRS